jgi:hypothetical protein
LISEKKRRKKKCCDSRGYNMSVAASWAAAGAKRWLQLTNSPTYFGKKETIAIAALYSEIIPRTLIISSTTYFLHHPLNSA